VRLPGTIPPGALIGVDGRTVQRLAARSGARVYIDRGTRTATLRGSADAVKAAERLVDAEVDAAVAATTSVAEDGEGQEAASAVAAEPLAGTDGRLSDPSPPHYDGAAAALFRRRGSTRVEVPLPPGVTPGALIGRSGAIARGIAVTTGASVNVLAARRVVVLVGTPPAVAAAAIEVRRRTAAAAEADAGGAEAAAAGHALGVWGGRGQAGPRTTLLLGAAYEGGVQLVPVNATGVADYVSRYQLCSICAAAKTSGAASVGLNSDVHNDGVDGAGSLALVNDGDVVVRPPAYTPTAVAALAAALARSPQPLRSASPVERPPTDGDGALRDARMVMCVQLGGVRLKVPSAVAAGTAQPVSALLGRRGSDLIRAATFHRRLGGAQLGRVRRRLGALGFAADGPPATRVTLSLTAHRRAVAAVAAIDGVGAEGGDARDPAGPRDTAGRLAWLTADYLVPTAAVWAAPPPTRGVATVVDVKVQVAATAPVPPATAAAMAAAADALVWTPAGGLRLDRGAPFPEALMNNGNVQAVPTATTTYRGHWDGTALAVTVVEERGGGGRRDAWYCPDWVEGEGGDAAAAGRGVGGGWGLPHPVGRGGKVRVAPDTREVPINDGGYGGGVAEGDVDGAEVVITAALGLAAQLAEAAAGDERGRVVDSVEGGANKVGDDGVAATKASAVKGSV